MTESAWPHPRPAAVERIVVLGDALWRSEAASDSPREVVLLRGSEIRPAD
jgi:hypothetical protein